MHGVRANGPRILILYGTTEGYTRNVVARVADRLHHRGISVLSMNAETMGDAEQVLDITAYDGVIVAASLHLGRYQEPVIQFCKRHHATLASLRSAFISVSLSAAGDNPEDWQGLRDCAARFTDQTGWRPQLVHQAAGAMRLPRYGFWKRLAMRHVAWRRGVKWTGKDIHFTDWQALDGFTDSYAALVMAGDRPSSTHPGSFNVAIT